MRDFSERDFINIRDGSPSICTTQESTLSVLPPSIEINIEKKYATLEGIPVHECLKEIKDQFKRYIYMYTYFVT